MFLDVFSVFVGALIVHDVVLVHGDGDGGLLQVGVSLLLVSEVIGVVLHEAKKKSVVTIRPGSTTKGIPLDFGCTNNSEENKNATNTNGQSTIFESMHPSTMEKEIATQKRMSIGCDNSDRQQYSTGAGHWSTAHPEPLICGMDDGVSRKLDSPRLKALGNSIVPQCSQWIGEQILKAGLI